MSATSRSNAQAGEPPCSHWKTPLPLTYSDELHGFAEIRMWPSVPDPSFGTTTAMRRELQMPKDTGNP
jgi:hypothetical protein